MHCSVSSLEHRLKKKNYRGYRSWWLNSIVVASIFSITISTLHMYIQINMITIITTNYTSFYLCRKIYHPTFLLFIFFLCMHFEKILDLHWHIHNKHILSPFTFTCSLSLSFFFISFLYVTLSFTQSRHRSFSFPSATIPSTPARCYRSLVRSSKVTSP